MKSIDEEAAALAAKQHGAFAGRQVGGSRSMHARRVAGGHWRRTACAGVFVLAGALTTWRQRLTIALLSAPDGAVASHRSAAILHGLYEGTFLELTAPPGAHRRPAFGVVHQPAVVAAQRTTIDGIPATNVERTLLDLATVLGEDQVERALEAALRRGLTTVERVASLLGPHRHGGPSLRRVLDRRRCGRPTGGDLEVLLIQLLRRARLPDPVRQHEVRVGAERYFLDLAYPERRLCIELDGRETHEGDAFQHDRTRQNALVLGGWTVLRFTWADVAKRANQVVALISQMAPAA